MKLGDPYFAGFSSSTRLLGVLLVLTACDRSTDRAGIPSPVAPSPGPSAATTLALEKSPGPRLGPPQARPEPRMGMVFVPSGALVVGTAPDRRPRRADRESPGEQVMLDGFYIDQFSFPNEEGGIPATNVTQVEAAALCAEKGKRLCSELEWERACKGPDNRTYEYGEVYREESCSTGRPAQLKPSGYQVGCQSDFGVRDLHGGPFEWTSGNYGRGSTGGEVTVRGGNSTEGEVVGRCANAEPRSPTERSGTVGFRCCAGPRNDATVELVQLYPAGMIARAQFEPEVEKSLISALPEEATKTLTLAGKIVRHRVWLWRPIANEEIHLISLCGRGRPPPYGPRCGLFMARVAPGKVQGLAWVSSGEWAANLHRPGPHEMLWIIGGDTRGSFKRLLTYRHGEVDVGDLSQGVPEGNHPDL